MYWGDAVMGNQLQVIMRKRPDVVATWSDESQVDRVQWSARLLQAVCETVALAAARH